MMASSSLAQLSADYITIKLPNGALMPTIAFGTYVGIASERPRAYDACLTAIDSGYRSIDTAFFYNNEEFVGRAVREKMNEGVVKRENLFITTKLWNCYHQPADVKPTLMKSLKNLGLEYIDLYLIHWPFGTKKSTDPSKLEEIDLNGVAVFDAVPVEDTWKAMEEIVDAGLCKAIGVSNFNLSQLKRIQKIAKHPISNLQIETTPYFTQKELVKFCHEHNISVTAYSPLYRKNTKCFSDSDPPELLSHPTITNLAEKYKKSSANIALRFQVQRGVVVAPKSFTPERIKTNIQIYDFTLTEEEMSSIDDLNRNFRNIARGKWIEGFQSHPEFPFGDELPYSK